MNRFIQIDPKTDPALILLNATDQNSRQMPVNHPVEEGLNEPLAGATNLAFGSVLCGTYVGSARFQARRALYGGSELTRRSGSNLRYLQKSRVYC